MNQGEGRLLVEAEERVHLRGQGQAVPVAVEDAEAVVAVDRPIGPAQRLHRESGIVSSRQRVAAVDKVKQIGEPLALRSRTGRVDIARAISRAKLAQPNRSAGVCGSASVAPGIGTMARPGWIDLAQIDECPVVLPEVGQTVRRTSA